MLLGLSGQPGWFTVGRFCSGPRLRCGPTHFCPQFWVDYRPKNRFVNAGPTMEVSGCYRGGSQAGADASLAEIRAGSSGSIGSGQGMCNSGSSGFSAVPGMPGDHSALKA